MERKLHFAPGLYVYLAAALLLVPLRWIVAAAAAAAVHELFHAAAIRILGHSIHDVRVSFLGARIVTDPMPGHHELICALAGPLGGLCLLPLSRWLGAVSICAAFHSLYNLLPLYPSDGGRALRCGARLLLPERKAEAVCYWIEVMTLSALTALGLWAWAAMDLGPVPLAVAGILVYRAAKEK